MGAIEDLLGLPRGWRERDQRETERIRRDRDRVRAAGGSRGLRVLGRRSAELNARRREES
jgi:hypothetical protein